MSYLFSSLLFLFYTISYAADPVSTFPVSIDKPSKLAYLNITWSEYEIKDIQITDNTGNSIQSLDISGDWTNLGSWVDHNRKDIIQSVDADFDGYPDLLIESSNGTAGQLFKLFKYDPKTTRFEKSLALDEIWNPTFDKKRKVVKGGANDMKSESYVWKNGSLKIKK